MTEQRKTPAGPYSIGSDHWPGVSKLIEESGEVLQTLGKLIAVNGAKEHWDGSNLDARLGGELADLLAAIDFVIAHNGGLDQQAIRRRHAEKLDQFSAWYREWQKERP